ncbi:MAG: molybdopterin-dependent oxidoreductase [Burkholderiales bacterium]
MTGYTAAHWGVYEVDRSGDKVALRPLPEDPDPSPIGLHMLDAACSPLRIARPAVRRGWLENGPGAAAGRRGRDEFVELTWDEAVDLAAAELRRVIDRHGNRALFGGSYGWASSGRFHHALSQIHRFLNTLGGYTRSVDTYSLGAARVLMRHIVAPMEELMATHTSWSVLVDHTQLFVALGGVPLKNAQITAGGPGRHTVRPMLEAMARRGVRFINVSPYRSDLEVPGCEWIPIRPNTDAALLLALAHTLLTENRHDTGFLDRYCVGFATFARYLTGADDRLPKDAAWAASITGVPAERIARLAREMASARTMLNAAWSLQRAHHGEQPFWTVLTVAAMLGQIGLPGGGFGLGYGAVNSIGSAHIRFAGPTLPQGRNAVAEFIPVARIADMLLHPGEPFAYDGQTLRYPEVKLIYWAGGNPFHHHQDLHRLTEAWQRPDTVIVHEQFWNAHAKMADIVLPATTTLERDDVGYAGRERYMVAMKQVIAPRGEARDDYTIFAAIAERLGAGTAFTENRSAIEWIRHLYDQCVPSAARVGIRLPGFDQFWERGLVDLDDDAQPVVMLERFRQDPAAVPLGTDSGKIEIVSPRIAGFGYADCPGHPVWLEPAEWLGSPRAQRFPLHLLSDQPRAKLHSQLDHSEHSRNAKLDGREPLRLSPVDALARRLLAGDTVRVFNDRGACLATVVIDDGVMPGVARMSTGAWLDIAADGADRGLERHGNPNVLTADRASSSLSQATAAQTCLVEVARFDRTTAAGSAFTAPALVGRHSRTDTGGTMTSSKNSQDDKT